uniref:Lipocalin/cytosolic fatty-acid binding domain-containing protein n=1 Tax=Mustela putorius furo TaxID=9669 RepID=M3YKN7_MUSPF
RNTPLLTLVLALLRGPYAPHIGPQDPDIDENLVSGNWFSVAQASKEPKLLWKDSDMMFFVHKLRMSPRTMEFHLYRRIQDTWVPIIMTAEETKQNFQYTVADAGHNTIFLEEVDPTCFPIFNPTAHRLKGPAGGTAPAALSAGRSPTVSWDIMRMFKSYWKHHRISPANAIYLTQMDRRPHARQ